MFDLMAAAFEIAPQDVGEDDPPAKPQVGQARPGLARTSRW